MVIGAGDCPFCRGDVVFDVHGGREPEDPSPNAGRRDRLREALNRLRRG